MSEDGGLWSGGAYPHPSTSYPDMFGEFDKVSDPVYGPMYYTDQQQMQMQGSGANGAGAEADFDSDQASALTDGMTPFDVLSSVFGATLAPSELEEALAMNGYDFERAMQWLIERARPAPPSSGSSRMQGNYVYAGDGVHIVPRGVLRGGRGGGGFGGRGAGRFGNGNGAGRPPTQTNNRVCRYFLQGECLRADCRFR